MKEGTRRLQARMLAILEEAGEEEIGTFVNMLLRHKGEGRELEAIVEALEPLVSSSLIHLAKEVQSCGLERLSSNEETEILTDLPHSFHWDDDSSMWRPKKEEDFLYAILSERGMKEAHRVLARHGCEIIDPKDLGAS